MSNILPIPQLIRGNCYHSPQNPLEFKDYGRTNDGGYYPENEPEYYDVDDTPLPEEDGVLRLKMPIARFSLRDSSFNSLNLHTTDITTDSDVFGYQCIRPDVKNISHSTLLHSSGEGPTLNRGVSVHMDSHPHIEDELFEHTAHASQESHFTIPMGQISVDQIIDRIKIVVLKNDDIHEIVPNNTYFMQTNEPGRNLYSCTLIYTTIDKYGNHRFARFNIRLQEIRDTVSEHFAVFAEHFQGDTRLSMEFLLTIRTYILSNGIAGYKVCTPDLSNWVDDERIHEIYEPETIKL